MVIALVDRCRVDTDDADGGKILPGKKIVNTLYRNYSLKNASKNVK